MERELAMHVAASESGDEDEAGAISRDLLRTIKQVRREVERYEQHLRQFETCRTQVAEFADTLRCGDRRCLVWRDFVNSYNDAGTKVINLVLVKVHRNQAGRLENTTQHTFTRGAGAGEDTGSTDGATYRAIMECALQRGGFLHGNQEIMLAGDHGPHFSALETCIYESSLQARTGVRIQCRFLCSYHA